MAQVEGFFRRCRSYRAFVAIVVVSLVTKKPDENVEKTFDEVKAEVKAKS